MTSDRPFDAVLCDLDGVIRHWPPHDDLEARYGLTPGTLSAVAFAPRTLLPAVTGAVTDERWREDLAVELTAPCGSRERARALLAEWGSVEACRVDRALVALLASVRRQVPVVLVTNATSRLEDDLDRLDLRSAVDAVVNSSRVRAAKPDPRIYLAAARAAGVPPARCLFVDDSAGNVEAARSAGMHGLRYRGTLDEVRAVLADLLAEGRVRQPDG